MCGIIGYVGEREAVPLLLEGLRRLEYRGYDSAGIAVIERGRLRVRRSAGKVAALEQLLEREPLRGTVGIAHTRWATHGRPCAANAHPHTDCFESLAVVHNGIIENHGPLKAALEGQGHVFQSETDTEVVAHLLESSNGEALEALARRAATQMRGAYALGVLSERHPRTLLGVRQGGPPLVVGLGEAGFFLASDVAALLAFTREMLVLEDGELAVIGGDGPRIVSFEGQSQARRPLRVSWRQEAAERGGFPHFMLKEIHEQPQALEETCRGRIDLAAGEVAIPEAGLEPDVLGAVHRLAIVACGTSWHAALVGKHLIESLCRLPVEAEIASEFRYRRPLVDAGTLTVAISQSGETADTLGALHEARRLGSRVLSICNVVGSSLERDSDGVLDTRAGPEIGVASTKAFTSQIAALQLLAIHLARARGGLGPEQARRLLEGLLALPELAREMLARCRDMGELARELSGFRSALYLGRGVHHPLALEGALKLKEISYLHAEGYAAGEMKHGPIALIHAGMPVVAIAPRGPLRDKMLGNIEEVKARDGLVVALASDGDEAVAARADFVLRLPRVPEPLLPVLEAIPLQLLAYHVAVRLGRDVDQPRNLAKSVTVE